MDRPTYLTKLSCIEQELPKLANTLTLIREPMGQAVT